MSREIRRVPLDLAWPLSKVWQGYLMDASLRLPPCPGCNYDGDHSTGYSREAWAISSTFYPHQIGYVRNAEALAWHDKIGQAEVDNLLAEGRLCTLVKREPTEDNPRDWEWKPLPRTAAEVNAQQRSGGFVGHDAINHSVLVRFRCKQLGITLECPTCDGKGEIGTDEQRAAYEAWESTAPPTGEGWQMWETVSEGSPVSPVFPDAEGLAQWLTTPAGGEMAGPSRRPMSIEQARGFVDAGWAPSFIGNAGGLHDGASYVGTDAVLRGHKDGQS